VAREGGLGLLSLQGSYYFADSAPVAVETQFFQPYQGVGGVEYRKYTHNYFFKGTVCEKQEQGNEKMICNI
jgi:hypothetical protein